MQIYFSGFLNAFRQALGFSTTYKCCLIISVGYYIPWHNILTNKPQGQYGGTIYF